MAGDFVIAETISKFEGTISSLLESRISTALRSKGKLAQKASICSEFKPKCDLLSQLFSLEGKSLDLNVSMSF